MNRTMVRAAVWAPVALFGVVLTAALAVTSRPVGTHPRITTTLLWTKDIAPILQRRCFACHSPNNVAMSLTTYNEARPWAAAIREEVLTRHMPPWAAVAGYGRFQNDPTLTQGEWDLLVAWVDGGAPSGQTLQEADTPPLFVPADATWLQGEPDVTAKPTNAQQIAANAPDHVQRVEIDPGFTTDQHVHGIAFKPGARRVVRYAAIYEAGSNRWLFTWTPWGTAMHLPDGVAFTVKAGTRLSVDIGYRESEEPVSDSSAVGFYIEKGASGGAASALAVQSAAADVPPGGSPVRFRAELPWDETAALQAVYPEAGPGTTSLELTAMLPDGGVRPLLWLRDYRADWPTPYLYLDPVPLPRGTKLVMTTYVVNTGRQAIKAQPRLHLTRVPAAATTF
jgi:hypothetical protein